MWQFRWALVKKSWYLRFSFRKVLTLWSVSCVSGGSDGECKRVTGWVAVILSDRLSFIWQPGLVDPQFLRRPWSPCPCCLIIPLTSDPRHGVGCSQEALSLRQVIFKGHILVARVGCLFSWSLLRLAIHIQDLRGLLFKKNYFDICSRDSSSTCWLTLPIGCRDLGWTRTKSGGRNSGCCRAQGLSHPLLLSRCKWKSWMERLAPGSGLARTWLLPPTGGKKLKMGHTFLCQSGFPIIHFLMLLILFCWFLPKVCSF